MNAPLTAEELLNIRGKLCPVEDCGEYDCLNLCDKCGKHHGGLVQLRPGVFRTVCTDCSAPRNCASCDLELPKYMLVSCDGERFCSGCCHELPGSSW